jgi:hypothetical protein
MSVTRADLLTRLRNPAKAEASTQKTILLTGSVCADAREAADEIERLRAVMSDAIVFLSDVDLDAEARAGNAQMCLGLGLANQQSSNTEKTDG